MAALKGKAVVKISMQYGKLMTDARFWQTLRQLLCRQMVMYWTDFTEISVALLRSCN